MLQRCGVNSLDDLYADVPSRLRMQTPYHVGKQLSEKEVRDYFNELGRMNRQLVCFAGYGHYNHYTPSIVSSITSRSEFLTAYTPYQPEISQGTLQYIFEYQSMMATLTGMDVSNASMYDGATATAEAMMMAVSHSRKRNKVAVAATLNTDVRRVVDTYARYHGIEVVTADEKDGMTDRAVLESLISEGNLAGVIVASPNRYGILEDYTGLAKTCHANKTLLIMNCVASDLGMIKTPGQWGADIACGDAQSLGMPLSYGGPYLGYICCSKALIRKLPGRIVGATTDARGQRVFVLTLQAREQHIRRDKATSNICSNQGLMALSATIYLATMGPEGLHDVCEKSAKGARYLANALQATGKMQLTYPDSPFLNEFLMTVNGNVDQLIARCVAEGILPGVKIDTDKMLIAVTEMNTKNEMDRLAEIVREIK